MTVQLWPEAEADEHNVDETETCPCGPRFEDIGCDWPEDHKMGSVRVLLHRPLTPTSDRSVMLRRGGLYR